MSIMVKYAHGCNSGMNIMVVTNQVLIRFQFQYTGRNSGWLIYLWSRIYGWRDHMAEGRTYYTYFAIWTWFLYSHRLSTVLSPYHRSFFVQWMTFNTETHSWLKVKRINARGVLGHKLNMSSQRLNEYHGRGRQKKCNSQKSRRTGAKHCSGHDRTIAFMDSQQLWLPAQDMYMMEPVKHEWRMSHLVLIPSRETIDS